MRNWFVLATIVIAAAVVIWLPRRPAATARGLASIQLPPGFTVELASKPGVVSYPMLGTLDDRGRLFLCESSGKTMKTPEMSADPNYVVSLIEDTDGDGVYDRNTTFADKLTLPAGAAWYRGSLYVAAPPYVYRFQDTNNDGVADEKEVLVQGWNLSANAASLHGPILGPDGWLYLTDGRHGFNIQTRDGRRYQGKASRIWRLKPDGTGLEWFAGGGFDNPVEVVFTEAGDMFGTMTYFTDPRDGMRDAILHYVEGGVYPKPYPVIDEFKRTGDLMPVMTKFARIAPSGLLRYRGASWGREWEGNLFSAQFNAHRVQRHRVSPLIASFQTVDEDFFVSTDPDLHPTDVIEDADGSLIVVDTGAWFIHGCPLSRVAKPDMKGALYRVRKKNAPRLDDPRGDRIAQWTPALLDDSRPAVLDRAVERLVLAGDAAVPALASFRPIAKTVRGATSAVYALSQIGTPDALAALRQALTDPRPEVRQAAARQAGMARDQQALGALLELLARDTPPIKRQAAAALGQIGDPRATPALLAAAASPEDRFVEHSIIYSLISLGNAPAMLSELRHASPAVRKAALIALDQMDHSPLRADHVLPLLDDPDPALRRASLWVVSRHPQWAARLTRVLDARLRSPQFNPQEAEMIGEAIAAFCADSTMRAAVAGALGDSTLDATRQLFLLDTAERCSATEFPPAWTAGLRTLLDHPDARVRLRAVTLIRARGIATLDSDLRRLAGTSRHGDDLRLAALSALGVRHPQLDPHDFTWLISRLQPSVDSNVKLAAAQIISRARLNDAQLLEIASEHLKSADPLALPNLLDAFRNATADNIGQALVQGLIDIQASLGAVGMQRVEQLVGNFSPAVRKSAAPLLATLQKAREQRLTKLKTLESVLSAKGDLARGREIFFGAKAGCSGCHTIGLEGGHVGPDLTSIGAIRSGHDLLEAIILPSESFVPGHEVYRVETAREVYSGVLGPASPDAIRLITGPGDEVRIPRQEIVKMGHAPVSLMPEGYDEVLTRQELTDLITYLRAQTARPQAPPSHPTE
jgi:putative membrane-bound dehydrogenase-like protein